MRFAPLALALLAAVAILPGSPAWAQGALALPGPTGSEADGQSGGAGSPPRRPNDIPFNDDMIRELGRRFNNTQRAREEPANEPAIPNMNRRINVSFGPGSATPIIETVKGYPTAVSFFDATGQPWPIQWDTNSNPAQVAAGNNCQVQNAAGGGQGAPLTGFFVCTPIKGSNTLQITPMSLVPRGGLVVSLEGAPRPISFLLRAGGERYDPNLSVHVSDRGPNARVEIMTRPNVPETGAAHLTSMLEGVPPAEAVPLQVSGVSPDALRAWRVGRNVYIRTNYTLISPEWNASESEGSLTVYSIPATPIVLVSVNGQTRSASLSE